MKNDPEHCRCSQLNPKGFSETLKQEYSGVLFFQIKKERKKERPVKLAKARIRVWGKFTVQVETPSLGMIIKKRKKEHQATHIMPGRPGEDVS